MSGRLLLAGSSSGVGKTTLVTGLLAAFRRRGLGVRPFKAGPDYLDPTYHALAAGVPGHNLDTWLVPPANLRERFTAATASDDLAIIEGVMGLYDGADYLAESGSTAELAKLLETPVILVLDVRAQARSAAAVALGFQRLDPAVPIAGIICNRVGSASHYAGVKAAIEAITSLPVLGGVPRLTNGAIPERHLGLVSASETAAQSATLIDTLADAVSEHCDLDALLAIAQGASALPPATTPPPITARAQRPIIAYAHDEAFSFYYGENLDLLRERGAELRPFSPLADTALPPDTAAIYLGGGYPELHAARLAQNTALHAALRAALANGIPCYAECGGLMYLTEGLIDLQGICHPLIGALSGRAVMRARRSHLGYVTVRALADTPLLLAGEEVRGHEFHYSSWEGVPEGCPHAYLATARRDGVDRPEGYARGNLLASYVHLHFWTNPALADRFVATAAAYHTQREARHA